MQIFNWLGTFTLPNLYHSDRLLIVLRPFHLHYILLCGYIMAATILNLHHKLGKLARNISQILSADVEVTVPDKRKRYIKFMICPNLFLQPIAYSIGISCFQSTQYVSRKILGQSFGRFLSSAHRVVSLAGFPNPEPVSSTKRSQPLRMIKFTFVFQPSAEDADELKTAELFPKARITYN
ncbi:unnamed protein product [Brugia pahangi]|uniref:Cytochrome b561 domain-containing protein n=1 Tax=Brugia pahangi TaxID=6280 RepID=A0A0N4TPY9_BRUPA|nr:unnamed protein product [Brugia pahangi]